MIFGAFRCDCPRRHSAPVRFLLAPLPISQCQFCLGLRFLEPPPYGASLTGNMVGRRYLLGGEPVTVLAQWVGDGPRNVALRLVDGSTVVRPARGLRKISS